MPVMQRLITSADLDTGMCIIYMRYRYVYNIYKYAYIHSYIIYICKYAYTFI